MTANKIEIGFALPPGPLKGQVADWQKTCEKVLPELEGLVSSAWMPDHFFWNDAPTYEALTVLTYFAARFPFLKFGSSVLGLGYRNPGLLAKMAATLDALSDGRFILGIGAGWKEDEYRAFGFPYPSAKIRLEQLNEALVVIKKLWDEPGPLNYDGKYFDLKDAYCEPRPDPRPLILVGGGGTTTMKLAARHADWWNLSDQTPEVFDERMKILKKHCEDMGRDYDSIRKTYFGRLVVGAAEDEARARGLRSGRSHYKEWTLEGALVGTPDAILARVKEYIALGIDYFILEVVDIEDDYVCEQVIGNIFPAIINL